MKTIKLVCLLVLLSGSLLAQDNYFTEAKKLSKLAETALKDVVVKLDTNGRPVLTSGGDKMNTLSKHVQQLVAASKQDAFKTGAPAAGPVPVPAEGAIGAPAAAVPVAAAPVLLSEEENKTIEKEILYAAWLLKVKSEDELKKVRDFPAKFLFLKEIQKAIEVFVGQSAGNPTNFAFSESAIIYGITDFIIRRGKEELVESYLEGWYNRLNESEILSPLLVQTLSVTKAFTQDNGLGLAKYGDKWKAAMQEDLRRIPHLLMNEQYVDVLFSKIPSIQDPTKKELKAAIMGGADLTYRLYLKEHVVSAVASIADGYCAGQDVFKDNPLFKRIIVLSDILMKVSGTLENNTTYKAVKLDDVETLDADSWMVLIKLMYARNNRRLEYVMDSPAKLDIFNGDLFSKTEEFHYLVRKVIAQVQTYQNLISQAGTGKLSFDDSRKLFEVAFGLFTQTQQFMKFFKLEKDDVLFKASIEPYFRYAQEIGEGISTQEYGKVLDGALGVFAMLNKGQNNPDFDKMISNLQLYGSFMLNILSADKPEQVEAALDELIPKGRYQLKNTKQFAVSLSAFPGVMLGAENIRKYPTDASGAIIPNQNKKTATSFSAAPYLPIGFDFSFHVRSQKDLEERAKKNKYASMSVGLQLVDLGAVLNYRLSGDSTESTAPEISWKQLLSPGAQVMWHFNNSPVVFGLSCNYTPELRNIDQKGVTYSANAFRFGVFLGVDVTIFNLHLSRRNTGQKK
ncbi:hypothetical protein AAHN97_04240 [Chitinophaga niabensis]|uniref:hypothetical protein n=1 Tax=Chitinophaga niabensis TaxID=536979 RepID=UPI0031BB58BF